MREALRRGEQLKFTEDEVAFYDAVETNDSAVKVLGDETLRTIARELVETVSFTSTLRICVHGLSLLSILPIHQSHAASKTQANSKKSVPSVK
jgi:Domain of unknown function (DUF3387)